MASNNYIFRSDDEAVLNRVRDEFIDYVGREAEITAPGELTVYAFPQATRVEREKQEEKRAQRLTKRERLTDDLVRE